MYKFARKGLGDRFWTLVIEIVRNVQKRVRFPRFSTGTVRPVDTPTQAVVNLWNSWVIYPFWLLFYELMQAQSPNRLGQQPPMEPMGRDPCDPKIISY